MIKEERLLKAVDREKKIRMILASTTGVVEEARQRHQTSATASAALGRIMTAALMMGSDLKDEADLITIKVDGKGPAGNIIATANNRGEVRAFIANPKSDLPSLYPGKLAVGELVGRDGFLEISRDMGLKQPFVGRTPLLSGEIAEDLANYFLSSEQIPSLVSLGVLVGPDLGIQSAGGLIVQALPGAADELLEIIESNIVGIGPLSHALYECESLERMLGMVAQGLEYDVVGSLSLQYRCNCSYERLAGILASLSRDEIMEICDENGAIEVCCNFCNEKYEFKGEDILALKSEKP
ncbi:MAG: Hsp33 family molecular chaperone HslO [Syntrophomonadaceae bacterium]